MQECGAGSSKVKILPSFLGIQILAYFVFIFGIKMNSLDHMCNMNAFTRTAIFSVFKQPGLQSRQTYQDFHCDVKS